MPINRIFVAIILFFSLTAYGENPPTYEIVQNFGWTRCDETTDAVAEQISPIANEQVKMITRSSIKNTKNAFNYRFLYKALNDSDQLSTLEKESGRLSALNQGSVGSCFMKDTLITMADGSQKEIQNIVVGDWVLTAEGNIKPVVNIFVRKYDGNMITLKLYGHYGLTMTENHKILTNRGYVKSKDLLSDDMVVMTKRPFDDGSRSIFTPSYIDNPQKYVYGKSVITSNGKIWMKQVPENLEKTYELGWVFGAYLAKGNISELSKIRWTWNKNEKDTHIKTLCGYLKKLGVDSTVKPVKDKQALRVCVYSRGWADLFKSLCNKGSLNKCPSPELMNGPEEFVRGVLKGWMDGDGFHRNGVDIGASISRKLIHSLFGLDISLGKFSGISVIRGRPYNTAKSRYDLYHLNSRRDSTHMCKAGHNCIVRRVRLIEKSNFKGLVYNFEVADDHSYIAESIGVSNCVGYATTQALNVLMATNSIHRSSLQQIWKFKGNPDAIYGIGRYDNRGSWDGSVGAWSVQNLKKYGSLHSKDYGVFDLTITKPEDGRKWAKVGITAEMLKIAADHKLLNFMRVSSVSEAKALLQNGYPFIICAQASYPSKRDKDGFAPRTGRAWAHALMVVSYRGPDSGREGFLIWNSWADNWIKGGVYPEDMPRGSFWVTPEDMLFHLKQKDSWALSGYEGFKEREINWIEAFSFGGKIK